MATSKQIESVRMGVYVYKLGGYVPFAGYPTDFACWNVDIRYEPDFLGESVQQALNGYERGGTMGWRALASVDLNNVRPANASAILSLLNKMQSQFNRLFYPNSGSVSAGTTSTVNRTVVITSAVQTDNYYTGLDLYNITRAQTRRITAYVGSTRVATLDSAIDTWTSGDLIQVYVPPAYPTIIGLAPDTSSANIQYYNINPGSLYGLSRELTIGTQMITLDLRGVERIETIPDNVRIGT